MKINKVFTFTVIALSAVALGGCLKKDDTTGTNLMDVTKEKITNAIETSKSTYCVMSTTEGGTIETWTKGEKVKTHGTNIGGGVGMGYMISDGQWTYLWVEGAAKGTKYPVTKEETPRSESGASEGRASNADIKRELADYQTADYKMDCSPKDIPDSTFIPPATVEFVDVMEKMGGMVEKMEDAAGSLEDFKN